MKACYPWSGQDACFDSAGFEIPCAGSGQDGEFRPGRPWPILRFEIQNSLTVLDRLTGLSWPRDGASAMWPLTWDQAQAWVGDRNSESFLGYGDWRLPTRRELLSLISLAHSRPALPPGHPFQNIFQHWHWTATASAAAPGHAWRVHFEGGRLFPGPKTAAHMVLPVRGTSWLEPESPELAMLSGRAWPEPRFEVGGGECLDRLTGLVWLRTVMPGEGEASWAEALDFARSLGCGWRLPAIWELESLVDVSAAWPALPMGHPFPETLDGVWSSTSSGYDPGWAWVLYFGKGAVGVGHKPGRHFKFLLTQDSSVSRAIHLDSARSCGYTVPPFARTGR